MPVLNKGQLFLVSAPSGAGKTSMVNELLKIDKQVKVSVSHTTRTSRTGEQDGKDYFFISETEFESLITADNFLEYARVYGNMYGTGKDKVHQLLAAGFDVILEIDWQGARLAKEKAPQAIRISIAPPAASALQERLRTRGQDTASVINRRMAQAAEELSHLSEAEYVVVNDDFTQAVAELQAIFIAERQRYARQKLLLQTITET